MQRVQKLIANAGWCSRRKAETLIEQGRVQVNGRTITIGDKADQKDVITIDGRRLRFPKKRYIMLHKPEGCLTTLDDPKKRKTVLDLIDLPERVIPVGRLDMNTSGLLLLTNDGDFANRIMHPRYEVDKTYEVELLTSLDPKDVARIKRGLAIEGQRTWPAKVQEEGEHTYRITIHEGRNRIIRKIMRKLKYKVVRLKRVAIGPLTLGDLQPGEWRALTKQEVQVLT